MALKQKPHTIQPDEVDAALEWLRENGPANAESIGRAIGRSQGGVRGVMALDERFYMTRQDDGQIRFNAQPELGEFSIMGLGHGWGIKNPWIAHHHTNGNGGSGIDIPDHVECSLFAIHPGLIDRNNEDPRRTGHLQSPRTYAEDI